MRVCFVIAFLMKPNNSRVILGDNATFSCQFPGMDVIEWKVNNVSLSEYTDVNINDQIRQNASGSVHTLTILALESYNETTVKCSARLLPSKCRSQQKVESDTVNLLIQGIILDICRSLDHTCFKSYMLWLPIEVLHISNPTATHYNYNIIACAWHLLCILQESLKLSLICIQLIVQDKF